MKKILTILLIFFVLVCSSQISHDEEDKDKLEKTIGTQAEAISGVTKVAQNNVNGFLLVLAGIGILGGFGLTGFLLYLQSKNNKCLNNNNEKLEYLKERPVMNGGFDKLLKMVNKIDKKINKMDKRIYKNKNNIKKINKKNDK